MYINDNHCLLNPLCMDYICYHDGKHNLSRNTKKTWVKDPIPSYQIPLAKCAFGCFTNGWQFEYCGDVDGSHFTCIFLSFFFQFFPSIFGHCNYWKSHGLEVISIFHFFYLTKNQATHQYYHKVFAGNIAPFLLYEEQDQMNVSFCPSEIYFWTIKWLTV